MVAYHQIVTMTFYGLSLTLANALELLLSPATELFITGCCTKYTFHRTLQFNWGMVLCCVNKTWWHFKAMNFLSSWGIHLLSFFIFPICYKCWMTILWSTLSSSATSHVVVRGSGLMMALNWSLSTSNGHPLCFLSSGL